MVSYAYTAMDSGGRIVRGYINAANPIDLESRLARMDLDYIDGAPVRSRAVSRQRIPRQELINAFFHLEQFLTAGVPVAEALADLHGSVTHAGLRTVLAGMIESIENGKTLSQAMAEHERLFGEIAPSLVRIGEETGKLPQVLAQLVDTLKWQDELAAQTRRLLLYPAVLATVMAASAAFMMIYLVPKLVGFTKSMGRALPLHTQILLSVSDFLAAYWPLLLLSIIGTGAVFTFLVRTRQEVRYWFDGMKLRIPWLGAILTRIVLARFAAAFAMMYGAGIAILDAIRAAERVAGNVVIADALRRTARSISAGESVAGAFQDAGLFPPLVIRMLRVGETTGGLDTALANVGYFYGRDVREAIERAQSLLEPVLTLAMGIVMGWIILSVFGPIYELITGLKV